MAGKLSAAEYLQATKANYIRSNPNGFVKTSVSNGSKSVEMSASPPILLPKSLKSNGKGPPVPPKKSSSVVREFISRFDQTPAEQPSLNASNGHQKPLKTWAVPPTTNSKTNGNQQQHQLYVNIQTDKNSDKKEINSETFKAVPAQIHQGITTKSDRNEINTQIQQGIATKPDRKPPAVPPKPSQLDLKTRLFKLFAMDNFSSSKSSLKSSSLSPPDSSIVAKKEFHKSTPNLLEKEVRLSPKLVAFDEDCVDNNNDCSQVQLRLGRQKSLPNLNDSRLEERKSAEGASTVGAHLGSTYDEADSPDESSHSRNDTKKNDHDDVKRVSLPRYRPYLPVVVNRHSAQNSPSAMQLLFPTGKEDPKVDRFQYEPPVNGDRLELSPALNKFFDSMGIDRSFLDLLSGASRNDCGESVKFFSSIASSIRSADNTPTRSKSSTSESVSEACGSAAQRGHSDNPQLNGFLQTQFSRTVSIVERNARVIKWIYACGGK